MNGKKLLKLCPGAITQNAEPENLARLKKCPDEGSFIKELKELSKSCKPCWIYGFPRTGSSWFCKYFLGQTTKSHFFEPFDLFQCRSANSSINHINVGSAYQNRRPKITKQLKLFNVPEDRLLLAMHKSFVFKFLFDSNIVPQLMELFPNSRFIWMVRDGRDSIESFANPKTEHWPPADFSYLGKDMKTRFEQALSRWIRFTSHQYNLFNQLKGRILALKYEGFSHDFKQTGKAALDFSYFSYSEPLLDKLSQDFKARHGLWKDWENWKRSLFVESGAQKINKLLGYENKSENCQYIWEQTLYPS